MRDSGEGGGRGRTEGGLLGVGIEYHLLGRYSPSDCLASSTECM